VQRRNNTRYLESQIMGRGTKTLRGVAKQGRGGEVQVNVSAIDHGWDRRTTVGAPCATTTRTSSGFSATRKRGKSDPLVSTKTTQSVAVQTAHRGGHSWIQRHFNVVASAAGSLHQSCERLLSSIIPLCKLVGC
jgi:hypothetical protein